MDSSVLRPESESSYFLLKAATVPYRMKKGLDAVGFTKVFFEAPPAGPFTIIIFFFFYGDFFSGTFMPWRELNYLLAFILGSM